jgi:hypothetical protein
MAPSLWGPTIIALLLRVAPKDAALIFVYVSLVVVWPDGLGLLFSRNGSGAASAVS